jgi:hypothetical protein
MSKYLEIIEAIDSPLLLILTISLFWIGRIAEKIIIAWYEKRGLNPNTFEEAPFILEKLVIKTVAELHADKGFIITHNFENQSYSVLAEYSPTLPNVSDDYQGVPFDKKSSWAIDLLTREGKILRDNLEAVDNEQHRGHMVAAGVNSWYCFGLNYRGQLIGSLNLYYIKVSGLNQNQTNSLTGRLALMGSVLNKIQSAL